MAKRSRLDAAVFEQVLLRRHVPGDSVRLTDDTMRAALDGRLILSAEQRGQLQGSPVTLRRFRALSLERSAAMRSSANRAPEGPDLRTRWQGSDGLLLAAESRTEPEPIQTTDGFWSLHFWKDSSGHMQVTLKLDPLAPFAAELVPDHPALSRRIEVVDGKGGLLLAGRLDADGELQVAWNYDVLPWTQIARAGGIFRVESAT